MEDEIASICTALGAAWGGAKACTATSGPGFTLIQEGIGWAAETDTPIVAIDVMRGDQPPVSPLLRPSRMSCRPDTVLMGIMK